MDIGINDFYKLGIHKLDKNRLRIDQFNYSTINTFLLYYFPALLPSCYCFVRNNKYMDLSIEERKLLKVLLRLVSEIHLPQELTNHVKLYLETNGKFPAYEEVKSIRNDLLSKRDKNLSIIEEKEYNLESPNEFENFLFEIYKCFRLFHLNKELVKMFKSYTRHLNLIRLEDDISMYINLVLVKNNS